MATPLQLGVRRNAAHTGRHKGSRQGNHIGTAFEQRINGGAEPRRRRQKTRMFLARPERLDYAALCEKAHPPPKWSAREKSGSVNDMNALIQLVASANVVDLLSHASSYPDHPRAVKVIETHISWVFLTDRYAYKLKKPVRFEFLDFSTPELRHHACLEELRLNRRLAPDDYIAVLPITRDSNGLLTFNGHGEEVDWVVQMRRLPAEQALNVQLREGRLTSEKAEAIARFLATFYAGLIPIRLTAGDYRRALERHIRANGAALLNSPPTIVSKVRQAQSAQLRYLTIQADTIDSRVAAGRIVEGHGDLRPEHIYLNGQPIVIDCIEFSDELRNVDIADDLSFLAMECERLDNSELGSSDLGDRVLATYQRVGGDQVPALLLAFYRSYRACVRAKVVLLRNEQRPADRSAQDGEIVQQYIDLAARHAAELGPPMLLIIGGFMGTGKSTLSAKLAETFDIEKFSTDHIRRSILGASEAPASYSEGKYQPDMRSRVYDELLRQAGDVLKNGESAILDGTFLTGCLRQQAYRLADRYGAVPLFVHCTCPRPVAYTRIQRREDAGPSESEARVELYDLQARDVESPWADEPFVEVDTTQPIAQQMSVVCGTLRSPLFGQPRVSRDQRPRVVTR